MGIKAVLRQYVFSVFVIVCATVLLCGIIFVRERTQYNIDMTEYAVAEIVNGEQSFTVKAGKRSFEIPKVSVIFNNLFKK